MSVGPVNVHAPVAPLDPDGGLPLAGGFGPGLPVSQQEESSLLVEASVESELSAEEQIRDPEAARQRSVEELMAVAKVMRLLEGHEGYEALKSQARAIAQALQGGHDDAHALLDADALPARHRYAIVRMAIDALQQAGDADLAGQLTDRHRPLLSAGRAELRTLTAPGSTVASAPPAATASELEPLFGLLTVKPNLRTLMDAAGAQGITAGLLAGWSRAMSLEPLATAAAVALLHVLAHAARTLVADAARLQREAGWPHATAAEQLRTASMLLDVAGAPSSGAQLDRLLAALMGQPGRVCPRCLTARRLHCAMCVPQRLRCRCVNPQAPCRCVDGKAWLCAVLLRHVRGWPSVVWHSDEARQQLTHQLQRRQNTPRLPSRR